MQRTYTTNGIFKSLLIGLIIILCQNSFAQQLLEQLKAMKQVKSVESLQNDIFPEKYLMNFTQAIDPQNPALGTFDQRVIVCHKGYDRPTVIVTEGYWADYALNPKYQDEIGGLFNTNVIVVEYRYFGKSCPKDMDWTYLTVANSLSDLHNVVTTMKQIYHGKWISTGISKGGQTTMFYRSYYPDDVDISVPYVAPLNKALEDGRHEPFLAKNVGTKAERQQMQDFMLMLLKRREEMMPLFKAHCDKKQYEFRVPLDEIYDLSVMEYQYAMWQWGTPIEQAPALDAPAKEIMDYFIALCDPDYFSKQSPYYSFYIMATKELGYYGYDIRPYRKYMTIKTTKDYMHRVMLAPSEKDLKFDKSLYKHVVKYLKNNDPKMIYIYGDIDPWGCSGVGTWLKTDKKKNLKVYTQKRGSHRTRITTFEQPICEEIIGIIGQWLSE